MEDTQILSTLPEPGPSAPAGAGLAVLVFDACQIGVVLRAVLCVELVLATGVMFDSTAPVDWLARWSLATGAALPAVLSWLLLACGAKHLLARLAPPLQYLLAVLMGGVAALGGCALLALGGLLPAPPWWASACTGMALAALLVAALVLRARQRAPAQAAARLAELQARIRPHFLFNTLNSAIALVRAEPQRAETLLEDLSELFRHALADRGEAVTLADEIALARRYLDIEQVRFGERLQVEWGLDASVEGARVPPLLLQPLVENAVRHGVEPSTEGAQLRISTRRRGRVAVVKVSNTVPAGPGPAGAGEALRNVRERLALLHDLQGQFRSGLQGGIFQVRMELPL